MKITIIGSGYVGLVTGTALAEIGHKVVCVDIDKNKIDALNKGVVPIYEPGLDKMILKNKELGRLNFTTDLKYAIKDSSAAFISVGTPSDEDGSADLKYVLSVASDLGEIIDHYMVIVTKSTVPVGTSELVRNEIKKQLNKRNLSLNFDVASNPEFLKEGDAVNDFMNPDRIIIGIDSDRAKNVMADIYKYFADKGHLIIYMDIPSAELTKYAANAMLATRISFMNEMALLCEKLGADVSMVKKGIGADPRIGDKFLNAGVGFGGSCFPKDVKALIKIGYNNNLEMRVVKAVEEVNDRQKLVIIEKLEEKAGDLKNKKIVLWGLAFKPETDDVRETPALVIAEKLVELEADVVGFDPIATQNFKKASSVTIDYADDKYEALKNADALLLITEWNEFKNPDFQKIKQLMRGNIILDGRNIYDPAVVRSFGFDYASIGRR